MELEIVSLKKSLEIAAQKDQEKASHQQAEIKKLTEDIATKTNECNELLLISQQLLEKLDSLNRTQN